MTKETEKTGPASGALDRQHSERFRQLLFITVVFGAVAAIAGVAMLPVIPAATLADYLVQIVLALLLISVALWMTLQPERDFSGIFAVTVGLITLLFLAKFFVGLVTAFGGEPLAVVLMPYSGWWPIPIVAAYVYMPHRAAFRVAGLYVLLLAAMLGVYALWSPAPFFDDFLLLCLAVQALFAHPAFLLLMHSQARFQQDLIQRIETTEAERDRWFAAVSRDQTTALLNRTGFTLALVERLARERPGERLVVLQVDNAVELERVRGSDEVNGLAAALGEALQRHRPEAQQLCRLGTLHFAWLDPAGTDQLRAALSRLRHDWQGPQLRLRAGAVSWQPGESLDGWLQRAEFAAFSATTAGPGVAFAAD